MPATMPREHAQRLRPRRGSAARLKAHTSTPASANCRRQTTALAVPAHRRVPQQEQHTRGRGVTSHWAINGRFLTQPQTGVQRYAGEITRAIDAKPRKPTKRFNARMAWEILLPADCRDLARPSRQSRSRRSARGARLCLGAGHPANDGEAAASSISPISVRSSHGRARSSACTMPTSSWSRSSYSRGFRLAYRAMFPLLARRARGGDHRLDLLGRPCLTRLRHHQGARQSRVIPNGHEHALRWNAAASRFSATRRLRGVRYVFALGSRARSTSSSIFSSTWRRRSMRWGMDLVRVGRRRRRSSRRRKRLLPHAPRTCSTRSASSPTTTSRPCFGNALCFAFPVPYGRVRLAAARGDGAWRPDRQPPLVPACRKCAATQRSTPRPTIPTTWLAQIGRLAGDPGFAPAICALSGTRALSGLSRGSRRCAAPISISPCGPVAARRRAHGRNRGLGGTTAR